MRVSRESLNRSLRRLGDAGYSLLLPPVFIEHELALAVTRFGTFAILKRIVLNKIDAWRLRWNLSAE